jgi:uncharacterized UBP type Zn finger protein
MDLDIAPGTTPQLCPHAPPQIAEPRSAVCEACGSDYNLRLCATCGHVGCCESQAGHGRAHALEADHAVILQMPAGKGFTWCYAESRYL